MTMIELVIKTGLVGLNWEFHDDVGEKSDLNQLESLVKIDAWNVIANVL